MGGQQSAPMMNVPEWVMQRQIMANTPQLAGGIRSAPPIVIQQAPQMRARTPPPPQSRPLQTQQIPQQVPAGPGAVGANVVGTNAPMGMAARSPGPAGTAAAAPAQILYQAQRQQPVQGPRNTQGPVTMAQLMGKQSLAGGYFTGGPEDSGICPASVMFMLLLVIVISIAIILSSYSCKNQPVKALAPQPSAPPAE